MIELLGQFASCTQVYVKFLDHMDGQANGTGLVHDRPFDGLPNPPSGVGRKTETPLRVELLDRANQPQIALFNQVQQRKPAIDITPGDFHHQTQVTFDHALAPRRIATLRQPRKMNLFLWRKQRRKTDFIEVQLGCIKCPSIIDVLVLLERRALFSPGPNRRYSRFV
ncbi:hypothetical protein D3C78_1401860 [compost metagenome]